MGENTTAFVSMVLIAFAIVPAIILVQSIPDAMINWPVMYLGGTVHVVSVFCLGLMANWKYIFKKKEE